MNENAIDDAIRQGAISDRAGAMTDRGGAMTDRGGAAAGFSWRRWQEKLERLCRLGEMCADDESTLKAFKRRVGREGGRARRGDSGSLLTERAVLAGVPVEEVWRRRSSVSLGGACRMMFSADGAVAVNLPRDYDWQMLPALFGMLGLRWDGVGRDDVGGYEAVLMGETAWQPLESTVARLPREDLVCAAGELGLAVAEVGSGRSVSLPPLPQTGRSLRDAKVVDISVMWAGPLCGDLLARAGAQVIKVESPSRPDGARLGLPEFYELLNGKKQHRSIRFDASEGRAELLGLLQNADIVITSCRPRALEQMGIDPRDVVSQSNVIWAGITGYGWEQGHKVAFGDDAAAAGGLICRSERSSQEAELAGSDAADHFENKDDRSKGDESKGELSERKRSRESSDRTLPCFIGDALADPLTGVTAAAAVMEQWLSGTPGFLDISMVGSAAFFCGED